MCVCVCEIHGKRETSIMKLNVRTLKSQEGRKEMFYLTTHSTHFIYDIWRQTYGRGQLIEGGNSLPPHGLLFPISSKGYFICIIKQTGYVYTSRGALAGTKNSQMGPP